MARDCKDALLTAGDLSSSWSYIYARRASDLSYYRFRSYKTAWNTFEIHRRTPESLTMIGRGLLANPISHITASVVGSQLTFITDRTTEVTDAAVDNPGDWYPERCVETAFECYDTPAPSGPAHRVLGSGIVNSRAIVRGASW